MQDFQSVSDHFGTYALKGELVIHVLSSPLILSGFSHGNFLWEAGEG